MTRRKRSRRALEAAREQGDAAAIPVDPDVARFVTRTREQQAAERERKRAKRERRQRAEEHQRRMATKDAAVAEVKRLRAGARSTAEQIATADAAYRAALADLIAFETGVTPAWAASDASGHVETDAQDDAPPDAGSDDAAAPPDGGDSPDEQG